LDQPALRALRVKREIRVTKAIKETKEFRA
jgi:hypothetical protein